MAKKKITHKKRRRWWFELLKKIMRVRYKPVAFLYLGDKFTKGNIILSNHEGTDAPLSLEIYCDKHDTLRMWGAHEMNSGLITMYKYQTKVYYHEKKHWNLHLARLFCLIASPLTNMFYKGLDLISTYRDARFRTTIKQSTDCINMAENIVIYPEVSDKGYLAELEGFHAGFVSLADTLYRKGIDTPIYVTYFRKADLLYVVDKPVMYSELINAGLTKDEIADKLRLRCNELGKMYVDPDYIKLLRTRQGLK